MSELNSKIYKVVLKSTLAVFLPLLVSVPFGSLLDAQFDIKPYGTVIASLLGLAITWGILIYMFLKTKTKNG